MTELTKRGTPRKRAPRAGEGNRSLYLERYAEEGRKLCLTGWIDQQLADFWGVAPRTIDLWKNAHPEFADALRRGKALADANVADALYHRAIGYEHKAMKLFQYEGQVVKSTYTERYAPDTQAAFIWLKNRQPDRWQDIKHREATNTNVNLTMSIEEERRLARVEAEEVLQSLRPPPLTIEHKPEVED